MISYRLKKVLLVATASLTALWGLAMTAQAATLDDVLDDILRVGRMLGVADRATRLAAELRRRKRAIAARSKAIAEREKPRVAFLEWLIPPFNGGHWNPELVDIAGGIEMLGAPGRARGR